MISSGSKYYFFKMQGLPLLHATMPTIFSLAFKKVFQKALSSSKTRRSTTSHVFHEISSEKCSNGRKNPPVTLPSRIPCRMLLQIKRQFILNQLTGNELKVAVWAPKTPNQFLLHVRTAIHAGKKMRINTSFANTKKDIEATILELRS